MGQDLFWQLNIARQTSLSFLKANEEELALRNRISAEDAALQGLMANGSILEDRVNAQTDGEHLTNRSIHRVESIVEDTSIFNGNQNEMPEKVAQEEAVPSQGDQVGPNPEEGRKAVSCPPQLHGDFLNPKH